MKKPFGLYLIATDPVVGYESLAQTAVKCNVRYLQLRMKDSPREAVAETARRYRTITRGTNTRFIVNDDLEVAMETDADGIHLGQTDLPITEARRQWNTPGKLFGLSTHSMEQAARALDLKPDYIGIGPVYPTQTKVDADPALGPEEVGRIAQNIPITSTAIGGITVTNLPKLLEYGAENFCVVSAVNTSSDPETTIRTLQKIWKNHLF